MIILKRLRYLPAVVLSVLAFISCDDDFNTIGGELVGGQLDNLPTYEAGVIAYSKKLNPVQTNNLPVNLLGVYNEPVYGQQIASVLAPIFLSSNNPQFGNEPTLDSVVLTLPYFSTQIEGDLDGNNAYRLDSIYGSNPFKLSIERSNFFLNDYDPDANFENRQRYYSDLGPVIERNLVGDTLYVDEAFRPSSREVVFLETNDDNEVDTLRVSPRMRINLPVEFFQQNIVDKQGSLELSNNNNFRNFLRGFYFKAEPVNNNGTMMLLNFRHPDAGIVLYYTHRVEDASTEEEDVVERNSSYKLSFDPDPSNAPFYTVNTFSQEFPDPIINEIEASNELQGAENLFLKGGEGSMAVIKLFEEGELEDLRSNNWLINEASLTFYVNQERIQGGDYEPSRIYLYNLENNTLLYDYSIEAGANPATTFTTHSPILERDEDGNGEFYKIRITEHIRQILNEDVENVKLGLVVTQNITMVSGAALKTPVDGITRVPTGSVVTPKGTVLHGNLSPDATKRLKFKIYYTETNN